MPKWFRAPACLTLTLIFAVLASKTATAQIPDEFTNLQVLPKDTGKRELIGVMRDFAGALGVRCNHCHVGESETSLEGFDFASDEKQAKNDARVMMTMTQAINTDFVSKVATEDAVEVTCVTCHRGQQEPRMLQDVLSRTLAADGFEAMRTNYDELRQEYYGRHTFDFGEFVLPGMAEDAARDEDLDSAKALLELNLEQFPDSEYTHMLLGQVVAQQGDVPRAIELFEKILEMNPDNGRARKMLERLKQ